MYAVYLSSGPSGARQVAAFAASAVIYGVVERCSVNRTPAPFVGGPPEAQTAHASNISLALYERFVEVDDNSSWAGLLLLPLVIDSNLTARFCTYADWGLLETAV